MKKWMKRMVIGLACLAILLAVFFYAWVVLPLWGMPFNAQRHGNPPLVPAWALECWLWDGDKLNEDYALELLNGYRDHDLPVRTYLIDFPWATRLNDFNMDEKRYPNHQQFLADLKKRDIRTVLWMTTMVNSKNSERGLQDSAEWFNEAVHRGYLCGGDYQWKWWLGLGGFVDYTNPEAMNWWRGMQDKVLDLGIDGWKLDDTASFLSSRPLGMPVPAFYQKTRAGWMTTRTYMDHFYRDELRHGQSKNPDFITLSRPIDSVLPWGHPEGFTPLDAAMVNWVGDNNHTWEDKSQGLERALRCILESANLGYNIIGSDVGGYHGNSPIAPDLYIRWAEFSTFCGLFLNGGHEERRLWMRTPEELELIRQYSWLHTELVPYMYCSVVEAHNGGNRLMRPMKEGKYQYGFGDWLLVAPMYTPSENREVVLPAGRWRYWFDDSKVIEGPARISRNYPMGEFPVYIQEGAIIPMHISREYTGIGTRDWDKYLTLNIYPCQYSQFEIPLTDKSGTLKVSVRVGNSTTVTLEGAATPHLLRVYSETKPYSVDRDGAKLAEGSDWEYKAENHRVIIKTASPSNGSYTVRYRGLS